ncbi:ECF RNA polymerase sigma factor SigK [Kribbella sp. NBC_01505]|uniref:ECF RNA polymerase sigma factor SigK n=1 Tax=Kribbella sp. NBC_01505 TaxID=2903580 RepID=UPI0038640BCC
MADTKTMLPWPSSGRGHYAADPPAELIARIADGDHGAFSTFYDALAPAVFGMCRRVLSNVAQAEEVTQDVMVELWRTAARYDAAKGSISSWVLTMAHRRAVDRYRSRHTSRQREHLFAVRESPAPHDPVAETAIGKLDAEQVRGCLATLTDRQREAIMMAYYGGQTYPEVAEALDIKLPTVKARIRDGLRRLRDCLSPLDVV